MKTINNLFLRGIITIIFGVILILWPEETSHYLVIAIGLFFILPGLVSLFYYLKKEKTQRPGFPVEAVGSIALGILLLLFPAFFISILMYLLGFLAIVAGISLIINLYSNRKKGAVSFWYYILPVIILGGGIFILANPEQVVENTFVIFGIVSVLFGTSLLIHWLKFRNRG